MEEQHSLDQRKIDRILDERKPLFDRIPEIVRNPKADLESSFGPLCEILDQLQQREEKVVFLWLFQMATLKELGRLTGS